MRSNQTGASMHKRISALLISAAAFGLVQSADAQVAQRAPASQPGAQAEQPVISPEQALREFLRGAGPVWAGMSWSEALPNLEVLTIAGFPRGAAGTSRIAPQFVATDVTLDLRYKDSTLTARRAYLLDDHIVLRDMRLENVSGEMRADFAVFSKDALTLIGQYLRDDRPAAGASPLSGEVVLENAIAVSQEFTGDRAGRGFASRVAADLLVFSGMTWGDLERDDAPILISGMQGAGLSGSARFAGSAEFSLAKIDFTGSVPELMRALMQRIGRGERAATAPAAAVEASPQEAQAEAAPEAEIQAETEEAVAAPAAPAPVTHPFALNFSDLAYSAARGREAPATIAARGGAVRGEIEENGGMQVTARLADLRATTSVFAGTPLEEITQQIASRAGGRDLSFDLALDAALSSDRLRLNIPCVTMPGMLDFSTEIDVAIPGLERMLTAAPGGRSGGAVDLLFSSEARVMAIQMVDQGLNTVLIASGLAPLGELIQSTLLSRLEGQEGMRMMMLQTALAPVTSILGQYDEQGSVALEARFANATNLPVALVGFLQSAKPVESSGIPGAARCDAIPLVQ
jgi:hypothetical protein